MGARSARNQRGSRRCQHISKSNKVLPRCRRIQVAVECVSQKVLAVRLGRRAMNPNYTQHQFSSRRLKEKQNYVGWTLLRRAHVNLVCSWLGRLCDAVLKCVTTVTFFGYFCRLGVHTVRPTPSQTLLADITRLDKLTRLETMAARWWLSRFRYERLNGSVRGPRIVLVSSWFWMGIDLNWFIGGLVTRAQHASGISGLCGIVRKITHRLVGQPGDAKCYVASTENPEWLA